MIPAVKNILSMTDKTMSDQVDKTSFEQQTTSQCGLLVKVKMRHNILYHFLPMQEAPPNIYNTFKGYKIMNEKKNDS